MFIYYLGNQKKSKEKTPIKRSFKKVKRSPKKPTFIKTSSVNKVWVRRGKQGLMSAYVCKPQGNPAYIKPFLDLVEDGHNPGKLDIIMVVNRKVSSDLDDVLLYKNDKTGDDWPFKQLIKMSDNEDATEEGANNFGKNLASVLSKTEGFKYSPKFEFAGDVTEENNMNWCDIVLTRDVHELVKNVFEEAVEDLSFFDDMEVFMDCYGHNEVEDIKKML